MLTSRPTVLLAFAGYVLKVGARKNLPPTTVRHDREEMRNSSYLAAQAGSAPSRRSEAANVIQ